MKKKQNRIVTVLMVSLCISSLAMAQTKEQIAVEKIYNESLGNGKSYEMLNYLSNRIGARMSGSPQAAAAVEWSRQVMKRLGADTVKLQEIMVPHWVRGEKEQGNIMTAGIPGGSISVPVCALGSSIGTGPGGITVAVL
jgi:carboxypeptidase Q